MVYEPQEDSFLLQKQVKKYAHGIVLDMGTGSGIQANEAAIKKKVVRVYALDIDREATKYASEKYPHKKIKFLRSNIFQVFKGDKRYKNLKFDTVIFNAPYLPQDEKIKDPALYGGKAGYELLTYFLHELERYIKPTTDTLIVISSHSGRDTFEKWMIKNHWTFKEIAKEHIFFEDIYVYLLKKG